MPAPGLAVAIGAYNKLRNRSDAPEIPTGWSEDGTVWHGYADFTARTVTVHEKRGAFGNSPEIIKHGPIAEKRFESIMI